MLQEICYPETGTWVALTQRPLQTAQAYTTVDDIFNRVQSAGDEAVRALSKLFDGSVPDMLKVTTEEFDEADVLVPDGLRAAIQQARLNIEVFHTAQLKPVVKTTTASGIECWRETRAIQRVGLYVPGGTSPLFSTVLMLGIPATIAGCANITVCTPPDQNGKIAPAILYTCRLLGIHNVYKIGGAQAIAAMTFGTQTIPKADKIFGPGNRYVTAAKQKAQQFGVAIDMPAGPSELLVIADETAVPEFVAADLLSQSEHGPDSQVMLVTNQPGLPGKVNREIQRLIDRLPRKSIAAQALANGRSVVLDSIDSCIMFSNQYAPEHLILAVRNAEAYTARVTCAGSVFMGNYSCESAGDYASGPNHTLPTNGYARAYSGVSVDSFLTTISFQELSQQGLKQLSTTIETMAEAEGLLAHKLAVSIRFETTGGSGV